MERACAENVAPFSSEKHGLFLTSVIDAADVIPYVQRMTSMPVTEARSKLYRLLDETSASHEPIKITGKRSNAVLISEEDWRSMEETLYLLSIPGMRESIREGMVEPLAKSSKNPGW